MMFKFEIISLLLAAFFGIIFGAAILECPEHSTFNGCMTRCPVTCMNVNNPPSNCISVCTVGCECMEGFVKINKSPVSQCVKMYECALYTTKQQTLPYPIMRKLAAAASIQAFPQSNISTLPIVSSSSFSPTISGAATMLASKQKQQTNKNVFQ